MFADLSSGAGNTAETWHQRHRVSQMHQKPVIVALSVVDAVRHRSPGRDPGLVRDVPASAKPHSGGMLT